MQLREHRRRERAAQREREARRATHERARREVTTAEARRMCAEYHEGRAEGDRCTSCAAALDECEHYYPADERQFPGADPRRCAFCRHYDPQANCPHYYRGGASHGECLFCAHIQTRRAAARHRHTPTAIPATPTAAVTAPNAADPDPDLQAARDSTLAALQRLKTLRLAAAALEQQQQQQRQAVEQSLEPSPLSEWITS